MKQTIETKAVLKEAKKRLKFCVDSEQQQRKRDKRVLEFQVGEYQWDEESRQELAGNNGTQAKRPMISVPKLRQPMNLVRNQFRAAHFGINIHPKNEKSSKKGAEVRQDLIRSIEADSGAEEVRFWAYDRAIQCGLGVYRIRNVYDDATEDPFDQKLVYERLYDQSLAYFDPAAQKADRSDGRFAFVLRWVPVDDFKEQWPDADDDYSDSDAFEALRQQEPDWVTGDGETRAVLVCEYFCKKDATRKYVEYDDGSHDYEDKAGKRKPKEGGLSRDRQETKIWIHTMTAAEVLDTVLWPGKRYIPLIPIIGEEIQPFDGQRRRMGMVEPAMDACQGYNYAVSRALEVVALEPKAPVVGYEGQFEGHEQKWETVNTRMWAYLEVKPTTFEGQLMPLPQRMQADTSKLGMTIQMAQQFDQDIQSATSIFDAALGKFETRRQSGKAVELLQSQSDAGTSGFMHSLREVSLPLDARILLDAMPAVYDRPGRVAQVIDAELRPRAIMLNAPFTTDKQTGMPMEAQEGVEGAQVYDLSSDRENYGVTITIGKSYQSRQQQGQEQLGEMIGAAPDMMMVFGDIWARFLDVPGAPEIADRLLRMIEQTRPGLTKKDDQVTPQQLQAQLQAKDGELKQMQQMLAQATQALETEMAKQQATLKKAEMDNATRETVTQQTNEMKMMLERLESTTAVLLKQMDLRDKQKEREHERGMARANAGMQMSAAGDDRQHASDEAERGRASDADEAERDRSAAAEQAERDRAMPQADGGGE